MKKYICITLLATLHVMNCFSQEISGFSTFNNIQLNPAYAGEDGRHAFNLAADISTQYFKPAIDRIGGSPQAYEFAYAADIRKLRSGAGIYASLFKLGFENNYKTGAIYDFNFKISENSNLRIGVQFNLYWQKVKFSEFDYGGVYIANDPDDELLPRKDVVTKKFNITPGLWYKMKEFNVGFSVADLLKDHAHYRGYSLMTYYNFMPGEKVKITPSLYGRLTNYSYGTARDIYFQVHSEFFNRIIIAGGYGSRQFDGEKSRRYITVNLGVRLAESTMIMFGYSDLANYTFLEQNVTALLKVNFK